MSDFPLFPFGQLLLSRSGRGFPIEGLVGVCYQFSDLFFVREPFLVAWGGGALELAKCEMDKTRCNF